MEKNKVAIGSPVAVGEITIIPITRLSLNCGQSKGGALFFGSQQPTHIIIISPSITSAFRITGEQVSLDQLAQEVPNIQKVVLK